MGPPTKVAEGRKKGWLHWDGYPLLFPALCTFPFRGRWTPGLFAASRLTFAWNPGARILWDTFLQATDLLYLESG